MIVRELINKIGFKVDEAAFRKAEKNFTSLVNKAEQTGRKMTMMFTLPFAAFVTATIRARSAQAQAVAQVEQGLVSTGGKVGRTFDELRRQASDFQSKTLFGDESILQTVTAQLLTFTSITKEAFDRTQQAVLDVTTRIRGAGAGAEALTATSIQLGKALNDPVANLGALGRSGIQFTVSQKDIIKNLAETNRLAEAQSMILDELEKQYGGAAEAARDASFGFRTLMNSFGDLLEDFGKTLQPFFLKLNSALEKVVKTLRENLSPQFKSMLFIVGALTAVIGPLILVFTIFVKTGMFVRTTFLAIAAAARIAHVSTSLFMLKFALIGIAVAAVGLLMLGIIDDVVTFFRGGDSLIGRFIDKLKEWNEALKEMGIFTLDHFINMFKSLNTTVENLVGVLVGIFTGKWKFALDNLIGMFKNAFTAIGNLLAVFVQAFIDPINNIFDKKINIAKMSKDFIQKAAIISKSAAAAIPTGVEHVRSLGAKALEQTSSFLSGGPGTGVSLAGAQNVNTTINLTLPNNPTEEQMNVIGSGVEKTIGEALKRATRSIVTALPEIE